METESKDGGEGVRELQDTDSADKTRDRRELRDSGTHDPGDSPVYRDKTNPEQFSARSSERRCVKHLLEDFDVCDLNTDIAVQSSGDETGDHVHDIGSGLPGVWRKTLHDGVVGVLALVGVDEETEEHVADVDEDICAEEAFPEIPGVSHLGHEGDEEHSSTIRVDGLVETVEGAREAVSASRSSIRWCASVAVDWTLSKRGAVGRLNSLIVRGRVGGDAHADEENQNVDPDSEVGEPSKALESSNLPDYHTSCHKDNQAHDEAQLAL